MFAKPLTLAAAVALTVAGIAGSAAEARHWDRGGYDHNYRGGYYGRHDNGRHWGHNRGHYRPYGYYRGGPAYYGHGYGRGHCRDKGAGGTIIGAIAGGLLGHEIANGRGDRGDGTTGAIIGAGVGALAGRAIDRDC